MFLISDKQMVLNLRVRKSADEILLEYLTFIKLKTSDKIKSKTADEKRFGICISRQFNARQV
jgi:hypothetical protein